MTQSDLLPDDASTPAAQVVDLSRLATAPRFPNNLPLQLTSFIAEHWHGGRETREPFVLGVHHGLFCVGRCWTLMLLMFAIGGSPISNL